MIIAENFNDKSIAWSGTKMERRGTYLLDALIKNRIVSIRIHRKYTFY
jgi:hypothetical protein